MMEYFVAAISFYASTICDFLMSEPIVYFTAGFLLILVVKVVSSLCHINY